MTHNPRLLIPLTLASLYGMATPSIAAAQSERPEPNVRIGLRAYFHQQVDFVERRVLGLAEAIPAEKYAWRPSQGIRSVREVYLHIAAGNYNAVRALGFEVPRGFNADVYEKNDVSKADVIGMVRESFQRLHVAGSKLSDADMNRPVDFFGQQTAIGEIVVWSIAHMHEHLGQSIAYARINGVVPPWTAVQPVGAGAGKQ